MDRLAQLLDPHDKTCHSYRQALVRLWVMAADQTRLNDWEQNESEKTIPPHVEAFAACFEEERAPSQQDIEVHPLALIRALDEHLAGQSSPSSAHLVAAEPWVEEDKRYWLVPVVAAARRKAALASQAIRHARWFHHHAVLPLTTAYGVQVTTSLTTSSLDDRLRSLADSPATPLRVWIAHFDDAADVRWDQSGSPVGNWRTLAVEPDEARRASLTQTLAAAREAGAHVIVFPEFTLDLGQRDHLVRLLRGRASSLLLAVGGAFHEAPEGRDVYNTAPLYNGHGRLLCDPHRKLRLFGDARHGAEHARIGCGLHVLQTPIGSMTVLICKDFLDEDQTANNLLADVPVDWVWVPSYGNETTLQLHQERARRLATITVGTSSAVAQTQNTALRKPSEVQALLPGFGHPAGQAHPVSVSTSGGLVEFALAWQPRPQPPLKRVK